MNKRNLKILVILIAGASATAVIDQVIGLSYEEIGLALMVVHKVFHVALGAVFVTIIDRRRLGVC